MKMHKRLQTFLDICGHGDADYILAYDFTGCGAGVLADKLKDKRIKGVCEAPSQDYSERKRKAKKSRYIIVGLEKGSVQRYHLTGYGEHKSLSINLEEALQRYGFVPTKLKGLGVLEVTPDDFKDMSGEWLSLPAL